jgi:hypothetical protein
VGMGVVVEPDDGDRHRQDKPKQAYSQAFTQCRPPQPFLPVLIW